MILETIRTIAWYWWIVIIAVWILMAIGTALLFGKVARNAR